MHSLWIGVAQRQFPKAIPLYPSGEIAPRLLPTLKCSWKKQKAPASNTSWAEGQQLDSLSKYEWFSPTDVSSVTLAQWWSMMVNHGPLLESNPSMFSRFPIQKTLYLKRKFPLPHLIAGNATLIQYDSVMTLVMTVCKFWIEMVNALFPAMIERSRYADTETTLKKQKELPCPGGKLSFKIRVFWELQPY